MERLFSNSWGVATPRPGISSASFAATYVRSGSKIPGRLDRTGICTGPSQQKRTQLLGSHGANDRDAISNEFSKAGGTKVVRRRQNVLEILGWGGRQNFGKALQISED